MSGARKDGSGVIRGQWIPMPAYRIGGQPVGMVTGQWCRLLLVVAYIP